VVGLDLAVGNALLSARRRAAGLPGERQFAWHCRLQRPRSPLTAALDVLDQAGVDAELALAQNPRSAAAGWGQRAAGSAPTPGSTGHTMSLLAPDAATRATNLSAWCAVPGCCPSGSPTPIACWPRRAVAVRLAQRWGVLPFSESLYTGTQSHHLLRHSSAQRGCVPAPPRPSAGHQPFGRGPPSVKICRETMPPLTRKKRCWSVLCCPPTTNETTSSR
jgi:hypothetical protein